MRKLAERYIEELENPQPLTWQDIKQAMIKYRLAAFFGVLSISLYILLYLFSADLVHIAQDTHHGHKTLFFIPILVALVFSLIHGLFTAHFWEVLGIKPKQV